MPLVGVSNPLIIAKFLTLNSKTMALTPEKKQQIEEISRDIGEALGTLIGSLIANAIFAGILYAILHYLIGVVTVTYLQVFGTVLLLSYIKNLFKK